jgi:adenine-specific DNA-methyltransferase
MTELIWDGKYDKNGRKVAPLRVSLPFQTVETVNESAQDRTYALDLFGSGRDPLWRNRLIWGDKKYVLPSLLPEFAGKVDLIYIDPPFATGADFTMAMEVDGERFTKQPSIIELKAYRDTWGRGLDSYLSWLYESLLLLHELLSDSGSIYLHVGRAVSQEAKVVCQEVFGVDSFRNDITWKRSHAHGDTGQGALHFGRVTESIIFMNKGVTPKWRPQYSEYTAEVIHRDYQYIDDITGERYRLVPVDGPGGIQRKPLLRVLGSKRLLALFTR